MSNTNPSGPAAAKFRYWLTSGRDFNEGLVRQAIRIEWTNATGATCGSMASWRKDTAKLYWWYADPPAELRELAHECAVDAYEHGVEGCEFVGWQTEKEMESTLDAINDCEECGEHPASQPCRFLTECRCCEQLIGAFQPSTRDAKIAPHNRECEECYRWALAEAHSKRMREIEDGRGDYLRARQREAAY